MSSFLEEIIEQQETETIYSSFQDMLMKEINQDPFLEIYILKGRGCRNLMLLKGFKMIILINL